MKIFLFHRVHPSRDILWDPVSPGNFEDQINYISKKFHVVALEDYLLHPEEYSKFNHNKIAAITFDDAYKDFSEYALPILKKYNCPVSLYIITDCAETGIPPWTYVLDYHILHTKKTELQIESSFLSSALKEVKFTSQKEKIIFGKKFKPILKQLPDAVRRDILKQVCKALNDVYLPENLMLNWEELKKIINEINIGSHTVSHPLLANIQDEKEILQELKISKETIQKHLKVLPKTISYPIGSYNNKVKKMAKEVGYQFGLAVDNQSYQPIKHDHYEIPRIELYNEPFWKTKMRINGTLETVKLFFKK